jgi:thioredoxin-related protein
MNSKFPFFPLIAILFSSVLAHSAAELKSLHAVTPIWQKSKLQFSVASGFHVNDKAPNQIQILGLSKSQIVKPSSVEKQKIEFSLDGINTKSKIKASVYVCDDALTVCEERRWTFNHLGISFDEKQKTKQSETNLAVKKENLPNLKKIAEHLDQALDKKSIGLKDENDFYLNSFKTAQKKCHGDSKIILEFSARWCPSCMRLEQDVWAASEFKNVLTKFIKVKMDSDVFATGEIKSFYQVQGIPTTFILNCQGDVLQTFVDYQNPQQFLLTLNQIAKQKHMQNQTQLEKKANKGDLVSAEILAKRNAMLGTYSQALVWYQKIPQAENQIEYWWSRIGEQNNKLEETEALTTDQSADLNMALVLSLQSALLKFPENPSSFDWLEQLAEKTSDKKYSQWAVDLGNKILADKKLLNQFKQAEFMGDALGFEVLKIYESQATALERLDKNSEALSVWKKAAEEAKKLGVHENKNGVFYRHLTVFKNAEQTQIITDFFLKNLSLYPEDPELQRRYAKFLLEKKDFKMAEHMSYKSLLNSYGRNEIYAATIYSKALAQQGKFEDAKNTLLQLKTRENVNESSQKLIDEGLSAVDKIRAAQK